MLAVNLGCSPHFKHGGEVGLGRSCCFSMPHRIIGNALRTSELLD
jgi:hypothetical protein